MDEMVHCPHCGAEMRRSAKACPACGSDEETGWSKGSYQEDLDLPDAEEYDALVEEEFGSGKRVSGAKGWNWKAAVAVVVGVVFLALSLRLGC